MQETQEVKLKPCPFCGETPLLENTGINEKWSSWALNCIGCCASVGSFVKKEEVIEAWNKRVPIVLYMKPNGIILSRNKQEPNAEGWQFTFIEQKNGSFLQVCKGPPFVIELGKQNDL